MSWTIFAFGSVLFFTSLNLLQRVLAVDSKNQRAMAVLFNAIAALMSIAIFALTGAYKSFKFPTESQAWIALGIASLGYGLFERGRFVAAKLLDASVFVTIENIAVLVAFVGSLMLYSEAMTPNKLLGSLLIITALVLVSINNNTRKSSLKGVLIAIVISILLGVGWMLDKLGAQYFNANTYNFLIWTAPLVIIFFPYVRIESIKTELRIASWRVFVLAGLNVVGYLLQLKALEVAEATRVIPIVQTSILFTVLLGIILLKERQHVGRKIFAGILAVFGAYLLI